MPASFRRHRVALPLRPPPVLLACLFLLGASYHSAVSGDDNPYSSLCLRQPSNCGNVTINYPFYTYNNSAVLRGNADSYCGYPGLAIRCDEDGEQKQAVLHIGDATYNVPNIDYSGRVVSLVDQDVAKDESCPRVDHNVTLPQLSWLTFPPGNLSLIFFLDCNFGSARVTPPANTSQIRCGSFGGPGLSSFVWPGTEVPPLDLFRACRSVIKAPVLQLPDGPRDEWVNGGYGDALRDGFRLAWWEQNKPAECRQCEAEGSLGKCAFNRTGSFIACLCSGGQVEPLNCTTYYSSSASSSSSSGNKKMKPGKIAGVVAGGFSFLLVAGVIAVFVVRKRKQNKGVNSSSKLLKYSGSGGTPYSQGRDTESGSVQDPPTHLFSYEELEEATDGFNDNRELGDGGFGTVYKGYLKDGRVVAVKRLYNNSYRRVEQFVNEAAILSRLRHPNLVMFYGCTSSNSRELLLVYEFVANGTVADHLHGHRAPERALSWPLRLNIAVESAAALTYLHAIEQPIVHRDVKTTNILLDADFHVKVADFGLSRLFPLDATHVSTAPQGTPGYVDPEYHQCYQLTDKSDVYSFGVVLVELISSMPAVDITRHRSEINLAGMAISKIQKCQLEELVDLELGYESDPATKKMMTMVAELAFRCLQQNGEMRPPIREVLEVLKSIQGECLVGDKGGEKDKGLGGTGAFSPNTVHAPWDSRATTPNTSRD